MEIRPITLHKAKEFVDKKHRHNNPPRGWKFGISVWDGDRMVGVATAGRPISKVIQNREPLTLEINRTCTDGTKNVNSMLYGAIWRAAKAMGYTRAITYTQAEESGASLRAAGWERVKDLKARKSWADSTANERLAAMRDPKGNGGVPRVLWEIRIKEQQEQAA